MILIIMAGGNLLFGLVSYLQEFKKMNCVREAIYLKIPKNDFTTCLTDAGLLDSDGTWIFLQFILVLISIVIVSIVEGKRKH